MNRLGRLFPYTLPDSVLACRGSMVLSSDLLAANQMDRVESLCGIFEKAQVYLREKAILFESKKAAHLQRWDTTTRSWR
jgi:hypothetical protein